MPAQMTRKPVGRRGIVSMQEASTFQEWQDALVGLIPAALLAAVGLALATWYTTGHNSAPSAPLAISTPVRLDPNRAPAIRIQSLEFTAPLDSTVKVLRNCAPLGRL